MTHFNIGRGVESKSSFENGKYFRNKIAKGILNRLKGREKVQKNLDFYK